MKILITGGAGFIGSNLAAFYLKQGHQVTLYDNLSRKNVTENINWLKTINTSKLEVIEKDVRDYESLCDAVKDKEVIFHEAGQTAVTTSLVDPRHDFEVNALGAFNLMEAVRTHNPNAIVFFASTNKVYGGCGDVELELQGNRYVATKIKGISEQYHLDFHSPYGCSKGTADQYIHDYSRSYNLKTVIFRQSCIYGEHQFGVEDQGWVAHFAAQTIKNAPITIFGDGKQVRDLLFIDDLVRGYDKALQRIDITAGDVFNMGGGPDKTASLIEVIDQLKQLSGHDIPLTFTDARVGDQKFYVSDVAKAKQVFAWEPTVDVKTGVGRLYTWLADFLSKA
jgi:CDP-paratose 2-epimerase